MVDKALLLRKMAELEEYLAQIKEFTNLRIEQYSDDWKTQRIVERTLQMMIEICVDTASHIISDEGYRVPKSYADTFRVLYENEIIEKDLFKRMEKMAKFRNIVVHDYARIDPGIVIGILRNNLKDLRYFGKEVLQYMEILDS